MPFLNRIGSGSTSKFGFRMGFAPGTPTSVTASLPSTYGNTTASVSWTAPVMVGSPAINDYVVQYSSDSGSTWTTFADAVSSATSVTVTGLTNGFAYVFRAAANNLIGTSAYSSASNSVTPLNSKIPTPLFVMDDDTQSRVGINFSNHVGDENADQSYVASPSGKYFYNYFDCAGGICPNDTFGTSHGWTGLGPEVSRSAYLKVQRFGYADSDTVFCSETSPPAPVTPPVIAPVDPPVTPPVDPPVNPPVNPPVTAPVLPACNCCKGTFVTEYRCISVPQGLVQQKRTGIDYNGQCGIAGASSSCTGACAGCSCPTTTSWGSWSNTGSFC